MSKLKVIHLLSGGLDSTTLLYELKSEGHDVTALLFDYKQQHSQELLWAKHHCRTLGIQYITRELPCLGGLTDLGWIVPNRNMIMISVAVNVAAQNGASLVTMACNATDRECFPDCRQQFFSSVNRSVEQAGYEVEISAPYIHKTKRDIFEISKSFGIKLNEIWTCYRGGSAPCENCPACEKLKEATCGL